MELVVVGILGPGSSLVIDEVNHLRLALCFLSCLVSGESSLDAEPGLYLGFVYEILNSKSTYFYVILAEIDFIFH